MISAWAPPSPVALGNFSKTDLGLIFEAKFLFRLTKTCFFCQTLFFHRMHPSCQTSISTLKPTVVESLHCRKGVSYSSLMLWCTHLSIFLKVLKCRIFPKTQGWTVKVIQKLSNKDTYKKTLQRRKNILEEDSNLKYSFYLVTESEARKLSAYSVTFQF